MALHITLLDGKLHDRSGFSCGIAALDDYLHQRAGQHQRDGIAGEGLALLRRQRDGMRGMESGHRRRYRRIGEAVGADQHRAAGQHRQHHVGVVFAGRKLEQQGGAQAERLVHPSRAFRITALRQAAEAQPAGAVDHQRKGGGHVAAVGEVTFELGPQGGEGGVGGAVDLDAHWKALETVTPKVRGAP